jgi:3',5'-cyclic AMP phosphodiesterase CpdA
MFRLAHISDIHLSKLTFHPLKLLSKRWIGILNQILFRKKTYTKDQVYNFCDRISSLDIQYLLVTGDISTTSLETEFIEAKKIMSTVEDMGIKTIVLPGNHDNYTKAAYKKQLFYKYFQNTTKNIYSLKDDGVEAGHLHGNWWYIAIDTTYASSIVSSRGNFSHQIESTLKKVIQDIPKEASIILANHFPFTSQMGIRKNLMRGTHLRNFLYNNPSIKIYLHGHTHSHCIADLRSSGLPIILDSGSTAHNAIGSWNLLEFENDTTCKITVYKWKNYSWQEDNEKTFHW